MLVLFGTTQVSKDIFGIAKKYKFQESGPSNTVTFLLEKRNCFINQSVQTKLYFTLLCPIFCNFVG